MQTFSQQGTLQDTVIVGAMDLIKSSTKKKIKCKEFSHIYFATPTIPNRCAYLHSLGKFGFLD